MAVTCLVLVTGLSGSGKSALSRHLTARGERAVSLDGTPDLCRWEDAHGHPVKRPDQPDLAWLRAHAWNWRPDILDTLLAAERVHTAQRVFLCGTAGNQQQLLDRFDLVVMLDIDQPTMLVRLINASRGNDFGKVGASRDLLVERYTADRRRMLATAAHVVDASLPIPVVADMIIGWDGYANRTAAP